MVKRKSNEAFLFFSHGGGFGSTLVLLSSLSLLLLPPLLLPFDLEDMLGCCVNVTCPDWGLSSSLSLDWRCMTDFEVDASST